MIEPKTVLASAAVGAGGYIGYRWLSPDLVTGHAAPPNPERLRSGAGIGRDYDMEGGGLAWDNRFDRWAEENPNYIRDDYGRRARIGTPTAAFMAYRLAVEMLDLTVGWGRLFYRAVRSDALQSMYRGFLDSGRYNLAPLNERETDILTKYVDSAMQAATCLRTLSRLYRAAGMQPHTSPSQYKQRLTQIFAADEINPMANHTSGRPQRVGYTVEGRNGWETFGLQSIQAFTAAYPDLTDRLLEERDRETVQRDVEEYREWDEQTRIANPFPLGMVAVWLVRLAVAVIVYKTVNAVIEMFWKDRDVQRAMQRQIARALEQCEDGDQAACRRATTLIAEYKTFRASWLEKGLMWSVIIGVVGGGSYVGYRLFNRRRRAARATKRITRELKRLPA